ncbi:MAG: response regulator transcription factor [Actinomycetota bacterium]|nr:response regulator transcription factor [Actinomycetota bacterium]
MILIVEDEMSIAEPLASALQREGFSTSVAGTAEGAREAVRSQVPDLVLLDVMLPDGDGRELLREIRTTSRMPVIMVSARGEETDMVVGLELGADDYVTKPFGSAELIARIRAVLRRVGEKKAPATSSIQIGDVRLDSDTHSVTQANTTLDLTLKEFDLLRVLMENSGRVVSRENLMDEVWDPHWFGPTKTLDVHVSSLRRKLADDPATPRYIHTVRGVGFRFASREEAVFGEAGAPESKG